jgi:hypothetical protein
MNKMIESEKIGKKIKALLDEKNELIAKLKPVPKGRYKKEFIGYGIQFSGGSLIDAIRSVDYNSNNAKFTGLLTYKGKIITKEKLKELRSSIIMENEPIQKRIQEIEEIIPILQKRMVSEKANEVLAQSGKNGGKIVNSKLKENEGKLVDAILKIVLEDKLKKFSLRNFEKLLSNIGVRVDHNTLQTKFSNQEFQFLVIAHIMRRSNIVKNKIEKEKLSSFQNWFESVYMKRKVKNPTRFTSPAEAKEEVNKFIDDINIDQ